MEAEPAEESEVLLSDEEGEPELGGETVDQHPDVLADPPSHGYNLRPRVPQVNNIVVKPKKSVRFSDVEMCVTHDSVAYLEDESVTPEGKSLELLPAFSRDAVSHGFYYALSQPVIWTEARVKLWPED